MAAHLFETADTRDMLCAQALAVVSQAVSRIKMGEVLKVLLNAEDVRRDVILWAQKSGHSAEEQINGTMYLQKRK